MLLVETYLDASEIEGVGVFAAQPIRNGELIYRFAPEFDRLVRRGELQNLPESVRNFVERYTYQHPTDPDLLVLDSDNGRHMNHSEIPNTNFRDAINGYAIRNIAVGEEIVCDYSEFEPTLVFMPSQVSAFRRTNGPADPASL